jgi:hypothetical protein
MKKKIIGIHELAIVDGLSAISKNPSQAPEIVARLISRNPEHTRTIVSQAALRAPMNLLQIVREATKAYPELSADIVYGAVSMGVVIERILNKGIEIKPTIHISIVIAATESSIGRFGEIIAAANEARNLPRN